MAQEPPSEFLLAAPGIQHRVPRRTVSKHPALQRLAFLPDVAARLLFRFDFTIIIYGIP
jgi:hypothetical protein